MAARQGQQRRAVKTRRIGSPVSLRSHLLLCSGHPVADYRRTNGIPTQVRQGLEQV